MSAKADHWSEVAAGEEELPRRQAATSGFRKWFATLMLRLGGWTAETPPPSNPRLVVVAAPHTSWWDGFWMLAIAWHWGMSIKWLVKDSVAPAWMKWWIRSIGGILVNRSSANGLVGQIAQEFRDSKELIVAIPPEGTRSRGGLWKSGFYFIAKEADIPICLSYLDYGRKCAGFGPVFRPTDVKTDMDRIRDFYKDVTPCYPEKFTPARLREEDEKSAA